MDQTRLHDRAWPHVDDHVGQALEPLADQEEHVPTRGSTPSEHAPGPHHAPRSADRADTTCTVPKPVAWGVSSSSFGWSGRAVVLVGDAGEDLFASYGRV